MKPRARKTADWVYPQRIAYVVSHSIMRSSDGYAIRTQDVARALVENGHEVIVFNQPGHPWIDTQASFPEQLELDQKVDGVRYIYLPHSRPELRAEKQLIMARDSLLEAFRVFRPASVMAASNWKVAGPAQEAAKLFGCPFFYEQRGFWELSLDDGPEQDQCRKRETQISQNAKAVFTLNNIMKDLLIRRGVPDCRIHLVPNGIAEIPSRNPSLLRTDISCSSKYLLGYIGSLSAYEGVSDLIHLIKILRQNGLDIDLMIVGSDTPQGVISDQKGPQELELHILAQTLGLTKSVHFIPRVQANKISDYYMLVDAIISPRHSTAMTDIVPPLKPYTAAAYDVPIYLTDINPHREIAEEIKATLFPAGDISALAKIIRKSLSPKAISATQDRKESLTWASRIQPMLSQFAGVAAQSELASNQAWGDLPRQEQQEIEPERPDRFNTEKLPQVRLKFLAGNRTIACLGPGKTVPDGIFISLMRQNILETLATQKVGIFIIDWAGLQEDPGEWGDLWGIFNMRLNRLIMDACRIGLDRGWDMRVIGPVSRSSAPLFRTVSSVLTEINPHGICDDLGKDQ